MRFDHASSYAPEQELGPDRFLPNQISFPKTTMIAGYNDISPRVGVGMDVFGTGKTSLKFNTGRYLEAVQSGGRYTDSNPLLTSIGGGVPPSTTRSWTDANGNFLPDCNLLNPAAQDLRPSGGDQCGALANQSFGQVTNPPQIYDPGLLEGWGVRADDWQIGASIQQEIFPRVSAQVGYLRRWYGNFEITDNQLVTGADFDPYSITAPVDSRLPGGGGYVVGDQWNISTGEVRPDARLRDEGEQLRQTDAGTGTASTSTSRRAWATASRCRAAPALAARSATAATSSSTTRAARNCHVALPFQTQLRGLATYTIPKLDVLVSGTFQSTPGSRDCGQLRGAFRGGRADARTPAFGRRRERHHQHPRSG